MNLSMLGNSLGQAGVQQFIVQVVAMCFTALALPRLTITSIFGPILMVLALSAVNVYYWDAELFGLIPKTFSLQIVGLLLVNGLLFWLLVKLLPGIEVRGFLPALAAPLIFSISSILINQYLPLVPWGQIFQVLNDTFVQLREYFSPVQSPINDDS